MLPEPKTPTPRPSISALQITTTAPPPAPAPDPSETPGTTAYYLARLGGATGLAQLFLAAGLLHLEGTAASLLASSYAGLSSLRSPFASTSGPPPSAAYGHAGTSADGAEAWRRDRERAARFFVRARALHPALDVPLLPAGADAETDQEEGDGSASGMESPASTGAVVGRRTRSPHRRRRTEPPQQQQQGRRQQQQQRPQPGRLEMPTIDVVGRGGAGDPLPQPLRQRRRRREQGAAYGRGTAGDDADAELSSSIVESVHREPDLGADDADGTWYLYLPGLVGAGTALLVVGLLSLQSWRKNQG